VRVVIDATPEEIAQLITSLMLDVTDMTDDMTDDVTNTETNAPDMEPDDAWWRNADVWRYDP
jgi:hypothetical protein